MVQDVYLKILLSALFSDYFRVFDNFIWAKNLFAKTLGTLEIYVSVSNNLCEKVVSSLEWPITFDGRFKVNSLPFFLLGFNLLSYE